MKSFICDICGREINSCFIVNDMKFCVKCFQETFSNKDKEIVRLTKENAKLRARLDKAVELPVKRGDTIYRLIGFVFLTIQEWQVQEIRLLASGKYFLTCGHEDTDDYCGMSSEHFGLWWFTDRSEAEARLAELKGEIICRQKKN